MASIEPFKTPAIVPDTFVERLYMSLILTFIDFSPFILTFNLSVAVHTVCMTVTPILYFG